jgi:hypothetical protein
VIFRAEDRGSTFLINVDIILTSLRGVTTQKNKAQNSATASDLTSDMLRLAFRNGSGSVSGQLVASYLFLGYVTTLF